MELDFIKKPLTDPDDNHMYRVAHFLQFMNGQGLGFKELVDVFSTGMDGLGALEGFSQAKGEDLQEVYTDFASAFIFGNSLQRKPLPAGEPADLADYRGDYDQSIGNAATVVSVPGEYATRLVVYQITDDPAVAPYKVFISSLDDSSLIQVRYILETNDMGTQGDLTSGEPLEVMIQGGTKIYFLVTNANQNQGTTTLTIEKPAGTFSYSSSLTAKIYNGFFTGDVSFDISSSVPFQIVRELVAPNGETMVLDIDVTDMSKGAAFEVEASVGNITITDQAAHTNMTASLGQVQWVLPGGTTIPGGSASFFIQPGTTKGSSLNFQVFINCFYSGDGSTNQCGSGSVVSIGISP